MIKDDITTAFCSSLKELWDYRVHGPFCPSFSVKCHSTELCQSVEMTWTKMFIVVFRDRTCVHREIFLPYDEINSNVERGKSNRGLISNAGLRQRKASIQRSLFEMYDGRVLRFEIDGVWESVSWEGGGRMRVALGKCLRRLYNGWRLVEALHCVEVCWQKNDVSWKINFKKP